ncbi:MAG: CHASE domain-containing protein [Ketobacteraceae bacterium]|nr:CHASE domain-containing protein [Ketobacteraceae bacterium]
MNSISVHEGARQPSAITVNLVVAVAYCLLGVLSQLLAVPPDYATPVWLAAGVALGAVIRYGTLPYLGIFIGALAANTIISMGLKNLPFGAYQLVLITAISLFSILQTAFTHYLIKRFKIPTTDFLTGFDILKFVVVCGPLGCLVASSMGTSLLVLQSIISTEEWLTNWVTWWVGDSIGTLVATPFVVHLLRRQSKPWQFALVSFSFLLLVLLAFFYVRNLEEENRRKVIADAGPQIQALFSSSLHEVRISLNAMKSFYESSELVSLEEFNHFSSGLVSDQSAIHAVEWLPLIQHEERQALVEEMRSLGFPGFFIKTRTLSGKLVRAPDKPDYLPIAFVYPYELNKDIHGLDVLSLSYRKKQIRSALKSGETLLSDPLKLIQEQEGQTAYILLAAVEGYRGENYTGLVQVVFRVEDLINRAVVKNLDLEGLTITDITSPNKPVRIYGSGKSDSIYTWSEEFALANRTLRIDLSPTAKLLRKASSWPSYLLLIGGLLYVAILEVVMLLLLSRERAIQGQVALKTAELAQAKEEADKANHSKTDFLAGMSHELRTPLNAVIGFTHRVVAQKNNQLDERNREALKIVEKNAHHLLGLINNLLDLTKIEKGKLELEYSYVCLRDLLLEAQDQFSLPASHKKSEIILSCSTDGKIEADITRIRQVLMNLLSNAIKFTANGTITLKLMPASECPDIPDIPDDGFVIQIIDTGIGIAEEDLPKLFNKFQKVGNTGRINPQGTGLGLALSREIVEMHGGTMWVASRIHEGTAFTIWLPQTRPRQTNV